VAGIKSGFCDIKNHQKLVICVVMLLADFGFRILKILLTILEPLHVMPIVNVFALPVTLESLIYPANLQYLARLGCKSQ